ncbi:MAG: helix-turn-helix domain-containing protein, partial [Pyrinomonadaceae bacterium]|nr:helix-turn-helix domain-containing protein [Pyrinomonadaceae bacterium]
AGTAAMAATANGSDGHVQFKLPADGVNFEDVERSLIMQAMERTDNNITKSAKLLGLTFRTLQYRLEKFGIKRDGDAGEETDES